MSEDKPSLLLRDGVLVAAPPAIAYLCSYLYELGFARYFRIPAVFISVEKRTLLSTVIGLAVIVAVGVALASLISIRFKPSEQPALLALRRFWPLLLVVAFVHLQVRATDWRWKVAAIGCLLWVALEWLAPVFEGKKEESFRQRFARRQNEMENMQGLLGRRLGLSEQAVVILLFSLFLLLAACYEWGIQDARKKALFMVASDHPHTIVLGIYGDKIILGQYDLETKVLESERRVVVLNDKMSLRFDFEKIEGLSVNRPEGEKFWKDWH